MKCSGRWPEGWRWIMGALGVLAFATPALTNDSRKDLQVTPNIIHMGMFFHGTEFTISGEIPEDSDAIMEVIGQALNEHFLRKGRRAGLWMTVGEIQIQGLPNLYMCMGHASPPSHSSNEPRWGYEALKGRAIFSGRTKEGEFNEIFQQFIQLKESEGLYAIHPEGLKITHHSEGPWSVQATFILPAELTPGIYDACLTTLKNGQVLSRVCVPFQVVMAGFPALLSDLAYHHGVLYGMLAVVIAIAAGFLMGFLFKRRRGH